MNTYPNLNKDPDFLKIKTKDDEIRDLKYKTEKHDLQTFFKSLETDNESIRKNLNH